MEEEVGEVSEEQDSLETVTLLAEDEVGETEEVGVCGFFFFWVVELPEAEADSDMVFICWLKVA